MLIVAHELQIYFAACHSRCRAGKFVSPSKYAAEVLQRHLCASNSWLAGKQEQQSSLKQRGGSFSRLPW